MTSELDQGRIEVLMREGDEHLRHGRGTQAEACFREILVREPDNPDALHRGGMIAFLRGEPREAVGMLRRAASIRGDDATLHGHLASALMACRDMDGAIVSWRRAIELAPGYAAAHAKLGDALFAKGDVDASESAYRKSIDVAPEYPKAYVGLGRLLNFRGRDRQAEHALRRSLELGSGDPEICVLAGTVLLEAGDLDAALELFESAVRANPNEPRGNASMGLALHWLGRTGDAETAYRRALEIDPKNPLALKHLGILLQEHDQLEAAAECFASLLRSDPEDDVARHMLAAASGETPKGPPDGYVTRLFDDYADRFDAHLATIAYHVPNLIRDAVVELAGSEPSGWRILDLGCGTGQCGEALRSFAAFLAGVDLAPRMIAKCRERGVYDSLMVASIADALKGEEQRFDLVVAGDVFTYVGDLSTIFPGCARSLRQNGRVAFSIESTEDAGYRLAPTGRYAHSVAYIDSTAVASGLSVEFRRVITIREDPEPIAGEIVVLVKATQETGR